MTLNWRRVGYVFLGGSLGTLLRVSLAELAALVLSGQPADFAYLFVVNLLGAFALGVMAKHPYFKSQSRGDFWATGFAGGFTTMSAVSYLLSFDGNWWLIGGMSVAGLLLYGIGYRIGRRAARRAEGAAQAANRSQVQESVDA